MTHKRMIYIIKNLPSKEFSKQEKREALDMFSKTDNVKKYITKNELQNALIYLLDMAHYNTLL